MPYISVSLMRGHPSLLRALVTVLGLLPLAGCEREAGLGLDIGNRAPDFSGYDVSGHKIKLSDYQGKVVLIDFWATWCGPCLRLIPAERKLAQTYGKRGFVILGVSADKDASVLAEFLGRVQLPWSNILDDKGELSRYWGVDGYPSWVLVDHKGVIRGRWTGGEKMDKVEEAVDKYVRIAEAR